MFCLVSSFAIGCETVDDDGVCDISLSIIQVSPDVLQGLHYIAQGKYTCTVQEEGMRFLWPWPASDQHVPSMGLAHEKHMTTTQQHVTSMWSFIVWPGAASDTLTAKVEILKSVTITMVEWDSCSVSESRFCLHVCVTVAVWMLPAT